MPQHTAAACGLPQAGSSTRTVSCVDGRGIAVAPGPSACASSRKMPSAQQDCIVPGTAGSSLNSSCSLADACSAAQPGGSVPHRVLNSTSGTCDCAQGWGGDLCTIPLLQPPTPCTRGVVDLNGTCCVGLVDAVSGLRCRRSGGRLWCVWWDRGGCGRTGHVLQQPPAAVGSVLCEWDCGQLRRVRRGQQLQVSAGDAECFARRAPQ